VATFILVHGANLGGWCWRLVTPSLRHAGHEVYAPSLTGCGDRAHLLSPDIGLDTWTADITSLMYYEDLDNVVLVGHSNGGAVALSAADRAPERVAHIVCIDGLLPRSGQALWELIDSPTREWMERQLDLMGDTWKSPPAPPEAWLEMARVEGWNEVIGRWAGRRAGWNPLKPGRDTLLLKGGEAFEKLPRTYIRCARTQVAGADGAALAREGGWPVVDLDSGHMPMFGSPQALVDLLLGIAEPYGA
jgi:pimeloyl-ACP methyl ester carboxylesterase